MILNELETYEPNSQSQHIFIYSSFNVNTIIMYIKRFIERKLNLRVQIISYSQFGSRTTIELNERYKIAH